MQPRTRLLPKLRSLAVAILLLTSCIIAAASAPSLSSAWDDASLLQVQVAYGLFSTARTTGIGNLREIDYGLAVTLLNLQPRTIGNIERAASLFARLNAENSDDENSDDEIGIASLYFLARLEQVHRNTPNLPRALELYNRLVREHPDHFYAQNAVIKIAILKLCASPLNADKKRALAEVETLVPRLKDPGARGNFDIILGTACIRFNLGDDKALHYLIEAHTLGIPVQQVEANILLRIANVAVRKGRRDLAIAYFERFLKEFPRSTRSHTVREKILELKGGVR